MSIPHHVRSVTGRTLATKIAIVERDLDHACRHWTGTPEEFRDWAERRVASALKGIGAYCFCDTPDEAIGTEAPRGVSH